MALRYAIHRSDVHPKGIKTLEVSHEKTRDQHRQALVFLTSLFFQQGFSLASAFLLGDQGNGNERKSKPDEL